MTRKEPLKYFSLQEAENTGWDDILKAIALIGFLVICFLVILRAFKEGE